MSSIDEVIGSFSDANAQITTMIRLALDHYSPSVAPDIFSGLLWFLVAVPVCEIVVSWLLSVALLGDRQSTNTGLALGRLCLAVLGYITAQACIVYIADIPLACSHRWVVVLAVIPFQLASLAVMPYLMTVRKRCTRIPDLVSPIVSLFARLAVYSSAFPALASPHPFHEVVSVITVLYMLYVALYWGTVSSSALFWAPASGDSVGYSFSGGGYITNFQPMADIVDVEQPCISLDKV